MKKTVIFLLWVFLISNLFVTIVSAETILDIVPDESGLEFENEIMNDDATEQLQEYTKFESIINLLISGVKKYLPDFCGMLTSLLMLVVLFSFLGRFSFSGLSQNYQLVVSCSVSAIMSLFLMNCFLNSCSVIEKSLETICVFCDASVPIITALLVQGGKSFSSAFFSYVVSLCGIIISSLNNRVFMPLIRIFLAIGCCGCVWSDVDFSSITDLIEKFIKWLIGIVFSVFTFAISIQNVLVRSADNTAQKILKNAAGGIPYIGNALTKGIDGAFVIAGGIKNSSCIIGVIVILSVFAGPMILMLLQSLALYIAVTVAKLFGQKDCAIILITVHKAYLLMLSLFLVSVLMCIICFLMICLGAN